MKIIRRFILDYGENWLEAMNESLVHLLPNGQSFYKNKNKDSLYLVDKDSTILCTISVGVAGLYIEEN